MCHNASLLAPLVVARVTFHDPSQRSASLLERQDPSIIGGRSRRPGQKADTADVHQKLFDKKIFVVAYFYVRVTHRQFQR